MIKLVCFDFDGVFTDGKVCFGPDGLKECYKSYNTQDGMGIKLLQE